MEILSSLLPHNISNDGEGDEIAGQREVNNSGQGGEGEAHIDENQNKESNQDIINNIQMIGAFESIR